MYEEDEGNGRLMPLQSRNSPTDLGPECGRERESVQHPEGAFEVSIVLEAPAYKSPPSLLRLSAAQKKTPTHTHT